MIRIGNQTAFSASSPFLPFEYAIAHNFDAFDWFHDKKGDGSGFDPREFDAEIRRYIHDTAQRNNIRLSVHAACNANPGLAESKDVLTADLVFALDIGARVLNIHFFGGNGIDAFGKALVDFTRQTWDKGIMVAVENTPATHPEELNALFRYLKGISPLSNQAIGICFDLGHANLCDTTRNNYLRFLDRLDPDVHIIHVHLHENYGDIDSHLPIFTGPSKVSDQAVHGLMDRLKKRGFSGSIILEQWPDPPSLLDQARQRLLGIIKG